MNLTCGLSRIDLTPDTNSDKNFALSALLNKDLRTEAICTKQVKALKKKKNKAVQQNENNPLNIVAKNNVKCN